MCDLKTKKEKGKKKKGKKKENNKIGAEIEIKNKYIRDCENRNQKPETRKRTTPKRNDTKRELKQMFGS